MKVEHLPIPIPGEGEIRLRVEAAAVNRSDILYRQGKSPTQPTFPSKIGYEAAGIVEAVGPGVDRHLIGQRGSTIPNFPPDRYGVSGELATVPAVSFAAYPEGLTAVEAASIWMQYLTAYGAIVSCAKVARDDFVLITAASSSVGLAAIDIVNAEGATSIAVTRSAAKRETLLALGAHHVIVSEEEDVVDRVMAITGGKGAGIVMDMVLGTGIETLMQATARKGLYLACGVLAEEATPYPIFEALKKALSLRAYSVSELYLDPPALDEAKRYIFDHLEDSTFKPKIGKIFKLDQIAEAHRYMESNDHVGKIVMTI
ncbi:zinc-dependent alcohol dehydrogenase family protein [Nguyenibacter vanlangensis]|uniref:Zinc-dependent alcohol dehydrogenase family protein n=1 Tax=Nguyenibacter vanlangensis TaxID=1216886 RepID=A0ABZ3D9E1_9PROT